MTTAAPRWNETRLWLELERRKKKGEKARSILLAYMPEISHVLHDAGGGVEDFTLHDEGHAFRVAERMVDIIPANLLGKLADVEVALLLFSAYLHDIGMSPGRGRVSILRNYLLTRVWASVDASAARGGFTFTLEEKEEFDKWLLEHAPDRLQGSAPSELKPSYLLRIDQDVAYYCRSRHNEWSAEWIETNIEGKAALYNGWVKDLIALCKSHHEGYEELRKDSFNPRLVPGLNTIVHLRYLACVLRVADVIEFDPERTPDVIFRHRDISPKSRIFWWKDREIAWQLGSDGHVTISARPPDAAIHRAVEQTIEDVERELRLCLRLSQYRSFSEYAGRQDLPHYWQLGIAIYKDVQPRGEAYHYINGTFRPNTRRLLEILGGIELYGDQLAAIREVLQNAFDAVREQIARDLLLHPDGTKPEIRLALEEVHLVRLRLEHSADGWCLVCIDSGAGMSREIIENYFLVSGSSRRPDIERLRRACAAKGVPFTRTAQFGIGALSYFLLAKRVIITTRRAPEADDGEGNGWVFDTDGLESFGELRPVRNWARGTEVRFILKEELVSPELSRRIAAYIEQNIRYLPCRFSFESQSQAEDSFVACRGWFLDQVRIGGYFLRIFEKTMERERRSNLFNKAPHDLQDVRQDFSQCLRWTTVEEELPKGMGVARVHLPWFMRGGDGCFVYFSSSKRDSSGQRLITHDRLSYHAVTIFSHTLGSWKGMATRVALDQEELIFAGLFEIDFQSHEVATVQAHRNRCNLTVNGETALAACRKRLLDRAVLEAKNSMGTNSEELAYINWRLAEEVGGVQPSFQGESPLWVAGNSPGATITKERIKLPILDLSFVPFRATLSKGRVGGEPVQITYPLLVLRLHSQYGMLTSAVGSVRLDRQPVRLVFRNDAGENCLPVHGLKADTAKQGPLALARFPPGWDGVAAIKAKRWFWNDDNPFVASVTTALFHWAKEHRRLNSHELSTDDPGRAFAWLAAQLEMKDISLYAYFDGIPMSFISSLLGSAGEGVNLLFMDRAECCALTTNGVRVGMTKDIVGTLIPKVHPDWIWTQGRARKKSRRSSGDD